AVAHSFWSEFFNRSPFDPFRVVEYVEPESATINHGRFHTMHGYNLINQTTPADADLFATLTMLTERFGLQYGMLHTCTLDSMGHRFGHDCGEMDHAVCAIDAQLAPFIARWRKAGYEVIVTADHGQSMRGHHGGAGEDQQDFALYYFGSCTSLPRSDSLLDQLSLAPTILDLLGLPIPDTMKSKPFLGG
ncbi:alkaline phosphatase family protein, partial [Pseudorhodobacter sp.]|uniref:alkaline phosphatase family protein n=1 Tax=Pseudorhodobacter sp. TaxID=1934400 RepID=UPI00264A4C43